MTNLDIFKAVSSMDASDEVKLFNFISEDLKKKLSDKDFKNLLGINF
jgi:hypothetical protein